MPPDQHMDFHWDLTNLLSTYGGFLSHRGTHPSQPFLDYGINGIFHEINHPDPSSDWVPPFMEPPFLFSQLGPNEGPTGRCKRHRIQVSLQWALRGDIVGGWGELRQGPLRPAWPSMARTRERNRIGDVTR